MGNDHSLFAINYLFEVTTWKTPFISPSKFKSIVYYRVTWCYDVQNAIALVCL